MGPERSARNEPRHSNTKPVNDTGQEQGDHTSDQTRGTKTLGHSARGAITNRNRENSADKTRGHKPRRTAKLGKCARETTTAVKPLAGDKRLHTRAHMNGESPRESSGPQRCLQTRTTHGANMAAKTCCPLKTQGGHQLIRGKTRAGAPTF